MTVEDLKWKKFNVLNDGFICLVDVMGDDSSIVQAARVSYGNGTKHVSDDRTLIRYLFRHRHSTPFEMVELKFLVRVPMDCWRQWIRHRTANVNEYSTRYSKAIDSTQTTQPGEWRTQAESNKQGSGASLPEKDGAKFTETEAIFQKYARDVYESRLDFGIAREQARKDLPLSTYTEAYWKIDLHNLLHFISLRADSHAQYEIQQYAKIIGEEIIKPLLPAVWDAFVDYRSNATYLTGLDSKVIGNLMACSKASKPFTKQNFMDCQHEEWAGKTKCRERDECLTKLIKLGIIKNE